MTKIVKNKGIWLASFLLVAVLWWAVFPTFAKFNDEYVTENDVVGFQFHFDLKMANLEEYEEVRVSSNSYEVFDVNVFNSMGETLYYGIWYQIVDSTDNNIVIARLESNLTEMTGELAPYEDKTVSVIIKNNSANDIIVNVGVNSSLEGVSSIEYLGGKRLITGSANEVDYYYDEHGKKYVSSLDSNQYFTLSSIGFDKIDGENIFVADHLGSYRVEGWQASTDSSLGSYGSGIISLAKNEKLYFDIGKENIEDGATVVQLSSISSEENSVDNRIMILGEHPYISGRFGDIALYFSNEELQKKCVTGKEDIRCSYHSTGKYFKSTNFIDSAHEMSSFDGKSTMVGNKGNGAVKVTPIVPILEIPKLSVGIGEQIDLSGVICIDGGNGCHIVKVVPEDTSDLTIGNYMLSFMVRDDDGVVYRYNSSFDVVS